MALALVLVGILSGLASVIGAILADLGLVMTLLAYPLGGMAGFLAAAGILLLGHAVPAAATLLTAQARD